MSKEKQLFGQDFKWGVAISALQNEGATNDDGKGPSIWDTFSKQKGKIKDHSNPDTATDFYHRYAEDLDLVRKLNFSNFRFSLAWARILPNGSGAINRKGLDYYHRIIDYCLEKQIEPWVTLYHWDLPQALENKGGWTNRDVIKWFSEYAEICAQEFGDKVKNWLVMNEPMGFTSLGYFTGMHAPGKKGMGNFLKAAHHVALSQAAGGKILRENIPDSNIGNTFSCSVIEPVDQKLKNIRATHRTDALLNRLFLEPALGLGYPVADLPVLKKMEKYIRPEDTDNLPFDFDFIGIQYYFRIVARHSPWMPWIHAVQVPAKKRDVPLNQLNLEVFPEGMYTMLQYFNKYPQIKKLLVSESGVCFEDHITTGNKVMDTDRIAYFKATLDQILRAKNEGVPVEGFFAWTLTDNFEWNEGYRPRFGLIYTDYSTQQRIIKDSGYWFRDLLAD